MSKTHFRSDEHKNRFLAAMQQRRKVGPDGKIDPEYGAAFYVLSSSTATWEKAANYITRSGIDFEGLLKGEDFSGAYSVLIELAGNLFNGNIPVSPVELMRLDEANFALAITALLIRRNGGNVLDFQEK